MTEQPVPTDPAPEAPLPAEPYRGIKAFRYADRAVFAAREWEKEQLLNLISYYRGSLVYGQSGVGKSSLIAAGIVPLLEQQKLQAEIIRLEPDPQGTFIVHRMRRDDGAGSPDFLPSLFAPAGQDLQEVCLSFEAFEQVLTAQTGDRAASEKNPVPVFIFDQFEQLITLFEESGESDSGKGALSLDGRKALQLRIITLLRECYYNADLRIKMIFIFREDYLAKFTRFLHSIPDLRDRALRVKTVSIDDLHGILNAPFGQGGRSRAAYPEAFTTAFGAQQAKLEALFRDKFREADVSLTDVQCVAQYLYQQTEAERDRLLGQENPVEDTLKLWYEHQLESFAGRDRDIAIDILCLLVLNKQTRNIYHEYAIIEALVPKYESADAIARIRNRLDSDTRLVRSEWRGNARYYEINSESLIPFINEQKVEIKNREDLEEQKQRNAILEREKQLLELQKQHAVTLAEREREKAEAAQKEAQIKLAEEVSKRESRRKIYILSSMLFLLIIFIVGYYFSKAIEREKVTRQLDVLGSANTAMKSNPTLAFFLAKQAQTLAGKSDVVKNWFIRNSRNRYAYIVQTYKLPNEPLTIRAAADKVVLVTPYGSYQWSLSGTLLRKHSYEALSYATPQSNSHQYVFQELREGPVRKPGQQALTLHEIHDDVSGRLIDTFYGPQDARLAAFAPNDSLFAVDDFIYKRHQAWPVASLDKGAWKDLMSLAFLNDGIHLVAGYRTGDLVVYNTSGEALKIFSHTSFQSARSVVSALAVTKDDKYLLSGGQDGVVRIWALGSLNGLKPIQKELLNYYRPETINLMVTGMSGTSRESINEKSPVAELTGHTDAINAITLSPDGRLILTGSNDETAALWSFPAGQKLLVLKGHKDAVRTVAFTADGRMMTGASNNEVYLWSRDNPEALYDSRQMRVAFSPFDYRSASVSEKNVPYPYRDTVTARGLLFAILNYQASLPVTNLYPEDAEYTLNIRSSIAEIKSLYAKLFAGNKLAGVSTDNRRLLYKAYGDLILASFRLLHPYEKEKGGVNYRRYALRDSVYLRACLLDTTDYLIANGIARDLADAGSYYLDAAKDVGSAVRLTRMCTATYDAYLQKYPRRREKISRDASAAYYALACCYLRQGDNGAALAAANKAIRLNNKHNATDARYRTALIRGYTMAGNDEAARATFLQIRKNEEISIEKVTELLLRQFDNLKRNGLRPPTDAFLDYLQQLQRPVAG